MSAIACCNISIKHCVYWKASVDLKSCCF